MSIEGTENFLKAMVTVVSSLLNNFKAHAVEEATDVFISFRNK